MSPPVRVFAETEHDSVADADAPMPLFGVWQTAIAFAAVNAPPLMLVRNCHEYGDVPVDGIMPLTVSAWSESSLVALTIGAEGSVSAGATITFADELDVSTVLGGNVTRNLNA